MTTNKTNEKTGQLDDGYVTKTDEELVVLCEQVLDMLRASRCKPSQGIKVMWSAIKAMYAAWIAFGGPMDSALAHLRQEYEDAKTVIVKEPPGTAIQDDN